jgi:hypothetical protein
MANKDNTFILTTAKSKLSNLTSGDGNHGIKYLIGDSVVGPHETFVGGPTGIVIPITTEAIAAADVDPTQTHASTNTLGDPAVSEYALTSGDLIASAGAAGAREKNGGAQKFINAVLDGAYRGYTSGVAQSSGLNSMTVTRGSLSLSSTAINDGTGIVNTYTRSYTVNFKYYQSGTINASGSFDPATTDIANDASNGVPF